MKLTNNGARSKEETAVPAPFRAALLAEHPILLSQPLPCLDLIGLYLGTTRLDEETGALLLPKPLLRRLVPDRAGPAALVLLGEGLHAAGVRLQVTEADHRRHRARSVILTFGPRTQRAVEDARDGAFLGEALVDMRTGRERSERTRQRRAQALRADLQRRAQEEKDPDIRARLDAFAALPSLARLMRPQLSYAIEAVQEIPRAAPRHAAARTLQRLIDHPFFDPAPSSRGGTARIFDSGLQQLPGAVREVLLPFCIQLDLNAAYLGPLLTAAREEEQRRVLFTQMAAGEDIWSDVVRFVLVGTKGIDEKRVRAVVKRMAHMCYSHGNSRDIRTWATQDLAFTRIPQVGARLLAHPLLQALLRGRDRLVEELNLFGRVETPIGAIEAAPGDDCSRAISRFLSVWEARFVLAAARVVQAHPDKVRLVADLHDGILVHFSDLRNTRQVQSLLDEMMAAVRALAESVGIPARMQLGFDPREECAERTRYQRLEAALRRRLARAQVAVVRTYDLPDDDDLPSVHEDISADPYAFP